jgi:hypothetical protein
VSRELLLAPASSFPRLAQLVRELTFSSLAFAHTETYFP